MHGRSYTATCIERGLSPLEEVPAGRGQAWGQLRLVLADHLKDGDEVAAHEGALAVQVEVEGDLVEGVRRWDGEGVCSVGDEGSVRGSKIGGRRNQRKGERQKESEWG